MAALSMSPTRDAHSLSDLMVAGDAACRGERSDELAQAARLLAGCVAVPFQLELEAVAVDAGRDLRAACRRWERVCSQLRGRLEPPSAHPPAR